jgi:hypothetical protein
VEKCPKKCLSIVPGYQEPDVEKHVDTVVKPAAETPETAKTGEAAKSEAAAKTE